MDPTQKELNKIMIDIKKEQERFEKWYVSYFFHKIPVEPENLLKNKYGDYSVPFVSALFAAWQAAREDEMTEDEAKEILKAFLPLERSSYMIPHEYDSGEKVLIIDANLNSDELRALAWWLENKL